MSELDIAEKRVPQDGRVSVNVEDRKVDLRVDDPADPARRGRDDPHPRQEPGAAHARRARARRRGARALRGRLPPGLRRGPRHRPDRLGQVDDALRGAERAQRVEKNIVTIEDPVEYRLDGHQPDQRQPQGRPRLRHRPALDPARRPRRDHGRRDPRRRDGADRDRGRADRPHGPDDPAHERRARARSPGCRRWGSRPSSPPRRSTASSPSGSPASSARHCKRRTVIPAGGARRTRASGPAPTSRPTSRSAARAATSTGYRGRIGLYSVMPMSERIKDLTIERRPRGARSPPLAREEGMLTLREDGLPRSAPGSPRSKEVARVCDLRRSRALRAKAGARTDDVDPDEPRLRRRAHDDGRGAGLGRAPDAGLRRPRSACAGGSRRSTTTRT